MKQQTLCNLSKARLGECNSHSCSNPKTKNDTGSKYITLYYKATVTISTCTRRHTPTVEDKTPEAEQGTCLFGKGVMGNHLILTNAEISRLAFAFIAVLSDPNPGRCDMRDMTDLRAGAQFMDEPLHFIFAVTIGDLCSS
jgi:hypothetical protein